MRHFNLAVVAFTGLYFAMGCGSNSAHLDGGSGDGGGMQDFSVTPGPDMTVAKATGCGAIYDCVGQGKSISTCEAKSTTGAKTKFATFITCIQQTCGVMGTDAGATAPCMQAGDMGVADCNQCFNNVIGGPNTIFVDMNNMKLMCMADGTTPTGGNPSADCGTCVDAAIACVTDCTTDADCMMLSCNMGTIFCDTTMNQCNCM